MMKPMNRCNPKTMSVETGHAGTLIRAAIIWAFVGCGCLVMAEEAQAPDLEFLEYLGSWEESDEDWVLFAAEIVAREELENKDKDDGSMPAPDGEKLAELDDE